MSGKPIATADASEQSADVRTFAKSPDIRRFADPSELTRVGQIMGVDPSSSDEELLELGVQEFNRAAWCLARSGYCFSALKARTEHGAFEDAIRARGISPQRAREAMQVAELVARLPEDQARDYASLPKSKAIELAKADPEVIEEFLEHEDGSERLTSLSVRELREELRKTKAGKVHVDTELERITTENRTLKDRLTRSLHTDTLPEFASITRAESVALTEAMDNAADRLESVAAEYVLNNQLRASLDDEQQRYMNMAAGTLFHTLRAQVARGAALLAQLSDAYGDTLGETVSGEHLLLAEEAQRFADDRLLIVEQQAAQAQARENARENNKPGKRGRKRSIDG